MEKTRIARASIRELREKIRVAEERKKHFENYLHEIWKRYQQGKISYDFYVETTHKHFNGKTLKEWVSFYEHYIKKCEKRIRNHKKDVYKKSLGNFVFAFVLIIFVFGISFLIQPIPTGFVISDPSQEVLNNTNVTIETTQHEAVLGQPVKWTKVVSLEKQENITLILPNDSENITVRKITESYSEQAKTLQNQTSLFQEEPLPSETENQEKQETTFSITGGVVSETGEGISKGFLSRFFRNIGRITGFAVEQQTQVVGVEIADNGTEYEIEYETPAPTATETELERGKQIKVSSPENVHYENVLAFTNLPESLNVKNPSQIKIQWVEENTYINPSKVEDKDNNGIYDYIEWKVPSLSTQTFNIIVITKAEHLNENREFISDIYEQVKSLDNVWSEEIPDQHYVRVTFERNLSSFNDITIFPRIVSGNPKVKVYEINDDKIIAEFTSLNNNDYNKIFLDGSSGAGLPNGYSQDTFDLKVIDGSIEIDHIIDPTTVFNEDCVAMDEWTGTGFAVITGELCAGSNGAPDESETTNSFDLGGATTANISFYWESFRLDATDSDRLIINVSNDDGSTWSEVFRYDAVGTNDASSGTENLSLESIIGLTSTMKLKLICFSAGGERCIFDNIVVTDYSDLGGDATAPQWSNNQTNSTFAGQPVLHSVLWTDDTQLDGYIFSFDNGTGTFVNDSFVVMTGTTNWSNVTKVVNSTIGSTIQWRVYANDSSGNLNVTNTFSYLTTAESDITNPIPEFGTNPIDTLNSSSSSITFDFKASDNVDIDYIQLFGNWSGSWTANYTNTSYANDTWLNVTVSGIPDGYHTWAAFANDSAGNSAFTSTNRTFTVDTTAPDWSNNSTSSTRAGTNVEHRVLWTDGIGISGYIFSFDNGTGTFVNDSFVELTGTSNWSNVTKFVNATVDSVIRWQVYANDTENQLNATDIFTYNTTTVTTRVQRGSATLTTGTGDTNVTIDEIDTSRSFILISERIAQNTPDLVTTGTFVNSTTLQILRGGTPAFDSIVSWEVVESSDLFVQRGETTTPIDTTTSMDINFPTAVDTSKSFIIVKARSPSPTASQNNLNFWTAEFINSTWFNVTRGSSGANSTVSWQVVEWTEATVQTGITNANSTPATADINSVNLSSSFIHITSRASGTSGQLIMVQSYFVNETRIALHRAADAGTTTASWFVIDHPDLSVQRGFTNLVDANPVDASINSVNISKTFTISSSNTNDTTSNFGRILATRNLTNDTNIQFQKFTGTGIGVNNSWFVVEFAADAAAPENNAPTIPIVYGNVSYFPTEASTTSITFNFTAEDSDGVADLNDATAAAYFQRTGETTRSNTSCVAGATVGDQKNYSCTIDMWYFDEAGDWTINVTIQDDSGANAENSSTTFSYQLLTAMVISPSALTWPSPINLSDTDIGSSNDPVTINNTGNDEALSINTTAFNLRGETTITEFIFANNFTISNVTEGCSGTTLANATSTNITSTILFRGNNSLNFGNSTSGQEQLFFCLKGVPQDISAQSYSSAAYGAWEIRILLVAVIPRRKRKKKLNKKNKILQLIRKLRNELKEEYSEEKEIILNQLIKSVQEEYKVTRREVLDLIKEETVNIPISIFLKELGALESLVRYMKENLGMRYNEIAELLDRDQRTIWTAYKKAVEKHPEKLKVKEPEMTLPLEAIKNKELTVLESVIVFLKEKGLKFSKIANLLGRDQRNIWTIYSKAKKNKAFKER